MANKIDTNVTATYIAEEDSLKTVSGSTVWHEQEPDSVKDIGSEYTFSKRDPINAGRKNRKGVIVGEDAAFGLTHDLTQENTQRRMQGILYADAREAFSTRSLGSAAIALTAVDGTADEYEAASGLDDALVGSLIKGSGMGVSGNDGLKVAETVAAGAIGVAESLTTEVSPPSTAKLEVVGHQFISAEADIVAGTNTFVMTLGTTDPTTMGLNVGQWCWIGGDATALTFVNNIGYARISAVAASGITFDLSSFTPVNETGTGLTVQIFWAGVFIRDEDAASIVVRNYQCEFQLGEDANGVQSAYMTGGFSNTYKEAYPLEEKITCEWDYMAMNTEHRTGLQGIKTGSRVSAPCSDAFNTTSDLYANKIYVHDASTTNQTALFGLMSEAEITVDNEVTADKALTQRGGFDASKGNISCGGSGEAFFTDIEQAKSIANSDDCGWYVILAKENGGIVTDMPLVGIEGGTITLEKNNAAKMPIEIMGACACGSYTMSKNYFSYLPDAAMPA